jgi:hypothetical protein
MKADFVLVLSTSFSWLCFVTPVDVTHTYSYKAQIRQLYIALVAHLFSLFVNNSHMGTAGGVSHFLGGEDASY